jgi:uncharacterized Zn finger protein (UPF0148 family)
MKRRLRLRSCESKVRFSDEEAAKRKVELLEKGGIHMRTYHCPRCGGVHLATTKGA